MQVSIYGQQLIKPTRQVTGAGGSNNGPLRRLQAALKKQRIGFAGSGHGHILYFVGHVGHVATEKKSLRQRSL